MIESGQSILQMAGTTAVIGMGVVFAALFLLSVYMHYFKIFIAQIEARHRAPVVGKKTARGEAPPLQRAPVAGASGASEDPAELAAAIAAGLHLQGARGEPGEKAAAAIAVGLHLQGLGGVLGGEGVAAVATALSLHRARIQAAVQQQVRSSVSWRMSGRLEAMAARVRRQER